MALLVVVEMATVIYLLPRIALEIYWRGNLLALPWGSTVLGAFARASIPVALVASVLLYGGPEMRQSAASGMNGSRPRALIVGSMLNLVAYYAESRYAWDSAVVRFLVFMGVTWAPVILTGLGAGCVAFIRELSVSYLAVERWDPVIPDPQ